MKPQFGVVEEGLSRGRTAIVLGQCHDVEPNPRKLGDALWRRLLM